MQQNSPNLYYIENNRISSSFGLTCNKGTKLYIHVKCIEKITLEEWLSQRDILKVDNGKCRNIPAN